MIRGFGVATALAVALFGATALPAAAAPDNKNTESFPVNCEGLGALTVTEVVRGGENSGGVVFGPDGQVFVGKHFSGTFTGTVEIQGGPTITFTDSFDEGVPGKGFQDRLITCEFTQTFTETFTLTAEDVAFLEIDESFIGATATFTGTASGTADVLVVGPS